MNKNRHQTQFLFFWTSVCALLFFHFTNCESYNQSNLYSATPQKTNPPIDTLGLQACDESPGSMACQEAQLRDEENRAAWISLTIEGRNPTFVNPNDFGLNISGNCNNAGFETAEIYFKLINNSCPGLIISNDPGDSCVQGLPNCQRPSPIKCVNGHWLASIFVGTNGSYDNTSKPFMISKPHTISVQLVVRNSDGKVYRNPSIATASLNLVPDLSLISQEQQAMVDTNCF